jgi:hypothetical protein
VLKEGRRKFITKTKNCETVTDYAVGKSVLFQIKSSYPLKPKLVRRERVRKDSIRVEEKRKYLGESERRFISEGEKRASC